MLRFERSKGKNHGNDFRDGSRMKRQFQEFDCSYSTHNEMEESIETEDSRCMKCLTYVLCEACYVSEVEEFLLHVEECESEMNKKQKRTR